MSSPDVSVVVVTYNCAPFVRPCLESVRPAATTGLSVEVVVADNASSDASTAEVRAAAPDARIIAMGSNLGFATAVNAALSASTGWAVLLLNPDTQVRPGAIEMLHAVLDGDRSVGVVAPRLLNTDGSDQGTARSFPTPAAAVLGRRSPLTRAFPANRWSRRYMVGRERSGPEPFAVDWVSGACLMARRDLALGLGGLDEGFFMHFEDADFCHRVKDAGFGVVCVPTAEVVHHEGGSRRGWPPEQVRYFHHGAYRYWTKHHAPQRWNPLRGVAAAALAVRAGAVMAGNGVHRHQAEAPPHRREQPEMRTDA